MADHGGGRLPQPGALVTPPQAWGGKQNMVHQFFDPSTYKGRTVGLPPMGPSLPMTDLTPATLRTFFDPVTYQKKNHGQKRAATSPMSQPVGKQPRMDKMELIQKFKLAAELNSISWEDIVVSWPCLM